jgi:nucleoside-diphosphate-sugar epimerase
LPDTPKTVFRPSIVLGDSRHAETTQFDMVKAFVFLAGLPVLPFRPTDKIDIVNVDFVADAIATLHQKDQPQYDIYHLSSGTGSQTFRELTTALAAAQQKRGPVFLPFAGETVCRVGEFSLESQGSDGQGRFAAESVYAVSGVEYGVR